MPYSIVIGSYDPLSYYKNMATECKIRIDSYSRSKQFAMYVYRQFLLIERYLSAKKGKIFSNCL